ncbi:MAG: hypothetical protein ABUL65_02880, partial [Opitutus sp.]
MSLPSRLLRPALFLLLPAVLSAATPATLADFQPQAAAQHLQLLLPAYPTTPAALKAQADDAIKTADAALAELAAQDPAKLTFANTFARYDAITAQFGNVFAVASTVAESAVDQPMRDMANEVKVKLQ